MALDWIAGWRIGIADVFARRSLSAAAMIRSIPAIAKAISVGRLLDVKASLQFVQNIKQICRS
jgi:hypothetical protein